MEKRRPKPAMLHSRPQRCTPSLWQRPRYPEGRQPTLPELIELQDEPIERLPAVDREFMDLLLKALSDDPAERPTAAEFSAAWRR